MLDAYIIDRIQREREQNRRSSQVPLYIEPTTHIEPTQQDEDADRRPHPRRRDRRHPDEPGQERGSVVIDFQL